MTKNLMALLIMVSLSAAFSGCSSSDACDEHAQNCRTMGWDYFKKYAADRNINDALKGHEYLSKGCDGGVVMDCRDMGAVYKQGLYGVIRDLRKAQDFYGKGCALFDDYSCEQLEEVNGIINKAKDSQ